MKIISDFTDYYDYAVPYNESTVFNRSVDVQYIQRNDITHPAFPIVEKLQNMPMSVYFSAGALVVGGKVHYFYFINEGAEKQVFWDWSDIVEQSKARLRKPLKPFYVKELRRIINKPLIGKSTKRNKLCKQSWDRIRKVEVINQDVHIKLGTPVFCVLLTSFSIMVLTNVCLKDFGFQKIMDPYVAYQTIEMYLTNEMAVQVDIPTPQTDIEKVESHGFDKVWSFRKRKQ